MQVLPGGCGASCKTMLFPSRQAAPVRLGKGACHLIRSTSRALKACFRLLISHAKGDVLRSRPVVGIGSNLKLLVVSFAVGRIARGSIAARRQQQPTLLSSFNHVLQMCYNLSAI